MPAIRACTNAGDVPTKIPSFLFPRINVRRTGLIVAGVLITCSTINLVRAQDNAGFYEIETKYIFNVAGRYAENMRAGKGQRCTLVSPEKPRSAQAQSRHAAHAYACPLSG